MHNIALPLNANLRLNSAPERMLDQLHFCDKVGSVDQLFFRISTRQNNMRHMRLTRLQKRDDLINVDVIITNRDIDFIQQNHVVALVQDQFFGLGLPLF